MAIYASNLVVYTGTDFEQTFLLEDANSNSALNLTDYTGSSQFKKYKSSSSTKTFSVTFPDRLLGKVKISMNAEMTTALSPGKYFYDLKVTSPSGVTTRVSEGYVTVKKSVTR